MEKIPNCLLFYLFDFVDNTAKRNLRLVCKKFYGCCIFKNLVTTAEITKKLIMFSSICIKGYNSTLDFSNYNYLKKIIVSCKNIILPKNIEKARLAYCRNMIGNPKILCLGNDSHFDIPDSVKYLKFYQFAANQFIHKIKHLKNLKKIKFFHTFAKIDGFPPNLKTLIVKSTPLWDYPPVKKLETNLHKTKIPETVEKLTVFDNLINLYDNKTIKVFKTNIVYPHECLPLCARGTNSENKNKK